MTVITKTTPANALPSDADMARAREVADECGQAAHSGRLRPRILLLEAQIIITALLDATARLLGDVERLEKQRDEARALYDPILEEKDRYCNQYLAAEAERARLAKRVAEADRELDELAKHPKTIIGYAEMHGLKSDFGGSGVHICAGNLRDAIERVRAALNPKRDTTEAGR